MSENASKGGRPTGGSKLGSNPLGGALDWLDEEPAPKPEPKRKSPRKTKPAKRQDPPTAPKADSGAGARAPGKARKSAKGRGGSADRDAPAEAPRPADSRPTDGTQRTDSTRRGVAAGYRRHTLLMREDQIEQLDRLYALEKLHAGAEARTKKDLVEEAFDLFFESESSEPRGLS